jgi:hypothetical protein
MIPENHLVLAGLVWCEPVTVITDGMLALLCVVLLPRHRGLARGFFALAAVAFALGGLRHLVGAEWPGLVPGLSRASNTANSLSLALLLLAVVPWGRRSRAVIVAGTGAVIIGHLWLDHFVLSVLHSAAAFITILSVSLRIPHDFRWFYVSFALSLLAGLTFGLVLAPATFFNHNDLAHLLLMGAYVALHRQLRVTSAG